MSWNKKNELDGKQFCSWLQSCLNLSGSGVQCCDPRGSNCMILACMRIFLFPNQIFLIVTLSSGFTATLWFLDATQTDKREGQVKGSGFCCKPLLEKSSMAKRTPLMWLHSPLPFSPTPAGQVQAAHRTSQASENSITTWYGIFFVESRTFAQTYLLLMWFLHSNSLTFSLKKNW